jgi:hypothetical protein
MAASVPIVKTRTAERPWLLSRVTQWTGPAWGAIGVTLSFVAITCWWLTQDHSIPVFDAGLHLGLALTVHTELAAGHVAKALTLSLPYPPFSYLVGALGVAVGGVNVASPIIAENVVFVPLLALGCYRIGRMAFGPMAGLLAVVFALGSPLITAQFHVFMTDAPETALVAASVWALLATDGFTRVGTCAMAGVAVGLGMLTKEPFILFVAGPVLVTAIRGRSRALEGLLVFALIASAIALPWYIHEFSQVKSLGTGVVAAGGNPGYEHDISPPQLSLDNFTWYLWNFVNAQTYLPLLVFSAIGWVWTVAGFVRRRMVSPFAPELAVGAFIGWLAVTETFVHDTRYSMPLLVYLAVFASGWITRLRGRAFVATAAVLGAIAIANTLGTSFGVGETVTVRLGSRTTALQQTGLVTVLANGGFLAGAPQRGGDMLPLMRALKRDGVKLVVLEPNSEGEGDFSSAGLVTLAYVAGIHATIASGSPSESFNQRYAVFEHSPAEKSAAGSCVTLNDGTGVWVGVGNPGVRVSKLHMSCPLHKPGSRKGQA